MSQELPGDRGGPDVGFVVSLDAGPDAGEVIGGEPGEPIGPRLRLWLLLWLRRHRRARAGLGLLAALGVVLGGLLAVRAALGFIAGPPAPLLAVSADTAAGPIGGPSESWQEGPGGRPVGPAQLGFSASVRLRKPSAATVEVIGISAPAGVTTDLSVTPIAPTGQTQVSFQALVDCPGLLTSRAAASSAGPGYGLQVRVRQGSRARTHVVSAGALGRQWRTAIMLACSARTARQDLTVTALSAQVDPSSARLELQLAVTNSGGQWGRLGVQRPYGQRVRLLGQPLIGVPPHGSASPRLSVVLDRCDGVPSPQDQASVSAGVPPLTEMINLYALAAAQPPGAAPPSDSGVPADFGDPADVQAVEEAGLIGPTGVLLAPTAATALSSALSRACGRIGPILALIEPHTVTYDRRTREVTVPLVLDMAPGRVRRLALETEPAGSPEAYAPLWTSLAGLVPDPSGQARAVVHYRASATAACPLQGGYLPGIVATLQVRDSRGDRVVSYSVQADLSQDFAAIPLICVPG